MKSALRRRMRPLGFVVVVMTGRLFWLTGPALALTPESPEVQAAVARACSFLAKQGDNRAGAKALVGLTFLKAEQPNHPRVKDGIAAVNQALQLGAGSLDVYTVGLMITFMTELPKEVQPQHAATINALIADLRAMQKAHGGWGYPVFETGDTSMTQYAVLALWSAEAAGYETPLDCWESVSNWLLRTQDPNGGFSYQGKDAGSFTPVAQDAARMTESICAAGSGCLYMCADYFGLLADKLDEQPDDAVLKRVKKPAIGRKGKETTEVDRELLWERIANANGHMDGIYTVFPQQHPYYYLYAFERYRTFRDYSAGNLDKEVEWYTEGANLLISKQDADGRWKSHVQEVGDVCDTCFATLFLLRSMLRKIESRLSGGVLEGGTLEELERKQRRAKGALRRSLIDIDGILGGIEEGGWADLENVQLDGDDNDANKFRGRLRELLAGAKSPQAKRAVLKKLAEMHNLDDVPLVIEALRDPDPIVYCAANDALRFLSRKFSGPGLSDKDDGATRKAVIAYWEKWYQSLSLEDE